MINTHQNNSPRRRRGVQAIVALAFAVPVFGACDVDDPGAGDTISPAIPLDATPDATVTYGPNGWGLDIYNASGSTTGLGIVFVHAGGWCCGNKSQAEGQDYTQYLIDQGHAVFSIDYVTNEAPANVPSGTATYPNNFYDVQFAVAWANKPENKAAYGYDRVVVLGASAGGHLAALAATNDSPPPGMPASLNPKPAAAVTLAAPIDMVTFGDQPGQAGNGLVAGSFLAFWGSGYSSPDDIGLLARLVASPWFHVDENDPPIYIASGENDAIAPPAQNGSALEQYYIDQGPGDLWAWHDVADGAGHNLANEINVKRLDQFLLAVAEGVFD